MALGHIDAPWNPGETDRYQPCERHTAALARLDYDRAWNHARDCPRCIAEVHTIDKENKE
ncbi:MAG: hypothetical protein L0H74_00200 [Brachybacterium sp.]|nr:hypothetical protein [Brachybacterium sp.]